MNAALEALNIDVKIQKYKTFCFGNILLAVP